MHKNLLTSPIRIYDKIPPESEHKGNLPQHNKGHIKQTTANIILGGEKQNLPCTVRNKDLSPFSFNKVLVVLAITICRSYQEVSISLLSLFIRRQTERKTTIKEN